MYPFFSLTILVPKKKREGVQRYVVQFSPLSMYAAKVSSAAAAAAAAVDATAKVSSAAAAAIAIAVDATACQHLS